MTDRSPTPFVIGRFISNRSCHSLQTGERYSMETRLVERATTSNWELRSQWVLSMRLAKIIEAPE